MKDPSRGHPLEDHKKDEGRTWSGRKITEGGAIEGDIRKKLSKEKHSACRGGEKGRNEADGGRVTGLREA